MNLKPEVILCFCTGSCPSMANIDVWELANYIRLELPVEYVTVHPMLCAPEDGHSFLRKILRKNGIYIVLACAPDMEVKLFGKIFEEFGLEKGKNWFPVMIKTLTTDGAIKAITEEVEKVNKLLSVNA